MKPGWTPGRATQDPPGYDTTALDIPVRRRTNEQGVPSFSTNPTSSFPVTTLDSQ